MAQYRAFADWLLSQMGRADYRTRDLARLIGCSHQAVSAWTLGRTRPEPQYTAALARVFGVTRESIEAMLGQSPVPSERNLDFMDHLRLLQLKAPIPIRIEGIASAGPGAWQDTIWMAPELKGRRPRALKVTGTCMAPRIEPGDTVIVDTEASPRPGRIVAAQQDGQIVVKRFQGEWLEGDDGSSIPIDGWQILGVAIEVNKPLE